MAVSYRKANRVKSCDWDAGMKDGDGLGGEAEMAMKVEDGRD